MKRSLASQIWDRGRSNGCAHNLANDGEKRGPNDTSHRLKRLSTPGSASPSLWRLSIQFKATAHKLALREPDRRASLGCGSLERHQAPCLPRTIFPRPRRFASKAQRGWAFHRSASMATTPDYYIEAFETGARLHPCGSPLTPNLVGAVQHSWANERSKRNS